MKSLLARIFVSFWLIIGITIGIAALGGYWYAERLRSAYDNFEPDDSMLEASAALASGGREGLTVWLRGQSDRQGFQVLVLDRSARDLLNRPIPRTVMMMLDRRRRFSPPRDSEKRDPNNLRRARPLTQLIGPNGDVYTFILVPTRGGFVMRDGLPARGTLFLLALLVSAAVSWLLAKALSKPVHELRDATQRLAVGDFDSRVTSGVSSRKDELGSLARDFDSMAEKLQRAAAQQIELSRNVSHELRSPLARLRVALELARRNTGDMPELARIDEETERLDDLIGQILSYARLESLDDNNRERSSLNELLADVVDDVNFECASDDFDGIKIETQMDADIDLMMHTQSVRSAIENVLRNAARYNRANTTIQLGLNRSNNNDAVITIQDTGPGVADHELGDLFEPFFRGENSGRNDTGNGLGLAIAKRAVESNHGKIEAKTGTKGGLLITITLPIE